MRRRIDLDLEMLHALFVEGDAGAAAGGGASPPPSTPAAAAPATSTETPPLPKAAEPPAAPPKQEEGVIAPPATEPPKASADDQRKYLAEKGGKAEDLAKLSDADLQKQYDDAKAKEAAPPEVKAEDIKITIPEGVKVDEKLMGDFKGLIADAKLTPQERAQKLFDLHAGALKAAAEGPYQLWRDTQAKWQDEVKADKELGGNNFPAMRSTIAKAITDIGGPEAQAAFEAFAYTGAANNPAIVRLIYRMSKALTEGGPVSGEPAAEKKGLASSIAAMYPSATGSQSAAKAV